MSLINCKECGKEISDQAQVCPNCGCPIEQKRVEQVDNGFQKNNNFYQNQQQLQQPYPTYNNQTQFNPNNVYNAKKKQSGLGIAGLIISFLVVTPLFPLAGLIMCIFALRNKNKKTTVAKVGIVVAIIMFIASCSISGNKSKETTESDTPVVEEVNSTESVNENELEEQKPEESTVSSVEQEVNTVEEKVEETVIEQADPVQEETPYLSREEYIASCAEIPYKTLARNPEDHIGDHIVLTVKIQQIVQGGLFDNSEYYRVYTNDEFGSWFGNEYFMYDERVDDDMKLLQDDIIKIYGEFSGTESVTRALTGTVEDVPSIKALYIELIEE